MKIIFVFLLFSLNAYALEYGCKIDPRRLNEIGTRVVENYSSKGLAIPDSMLVTFAAEGEWDQENDTTEKDFTGTLEGFYRPAEDNFYVLPVPVFGASLSRDRNVIYICAHYDSKNPERTHMTIYMMRGYHLQPTNLSTVIGDTFLKPQLKVQPLNLSFLTIGSVGRRLIPAMKWLSFFDIGVKTMDGLQRLLTNLLGDTFGLGVERIVITEKTLELANGIDLNNVNAPRIRKVIDFKKLAQ